MEREFNEKIKRDLHESITHVQENLIKIYEMTEKLTVGDIYAVQKEFGLSDEIACIILNIGSYR